MTATTAFAPDLIPMLRYGDARAGIAWLERVLRFQPHFVVDGDDGTVAHAQLRVGRGFLMCSSARQDDDHLRTPRELGGANTQSAYIATTEVVDLHARARASGETIVRDLNDTDYGSTDFSLLDPEGNLWSVGTYHPTVELPEGADGGALPPEIFSAARYADARAAIAFLEAAFGATEQFVVPGAGNEVAHAQLRFGSSIYMLGSARSDELALKTPAQVGGANTQTVYACVADVDAHCARARAAGASIVTEPYDTAYASREYAARDLEGHLWTFGTYRPSPAV